MFQQRSKTSLSQGCVLSFMADEWRHFKEWRHYIVLNHSCDLENKSNEIEYLLLVEANSVITDIITMLENKFNSSLNEANEAYKFDFESLINTDWTINISLFYESLLWIHERIGISYKLLEIINALWTEIETLGYDLKQFLHFDHSSKKEKSFRALHIMFEQYLDKYLRFLKKEHISLDTDYSSSKPSTFFLFMEVEESSFPDFLEVNFLKTIPLDMMEVERLLTAGIFDCKLELASPYRESFAKKFWDFFSRVALP